MPQPAGSWADVGGSAQYRACVVDQCAEQGELAGSGAYAIGAALAGPEVPVSGEKPHPVAHTGGGSGDGFSAAVPRRLQGLSGARAIRETADNEGSGTHSQSTHFDRSPAVDSATCGISGSC